MTIERRKLAALRCCRIVLDKIYDLGIALPDQFDIYEEILSHPEEHAGDVRWLAKSYVDLEDKIFHHFSVMVRSSVEMSEINPSTLHFMYAFSSVCNMVYLENRDRLAGIAMAKQIFASEMNRP